MNLLSFARRPLAAHCLAVLLASLACGAAASPGAHGPNGEHLDVAAAGPVAADGDPRLETFSELFELVARLQHDTLTLELGRYATNEPVANAKIEIESGAIKTVAAFDAASGGYRVSDRALLQALGAPGAHSLVFTITAGKESDLLEGTLRVAAHDDAHEAGHGGLPASAWPMAASAVFVAGVALFNWRRRDASRRRGGTRMKPHALRIRRVATALLALIPAIASASPGAHGPNGEHLDGPVQTVRSGLGRLPDGSVSVPMAAQRRMGLRTAMPAASEAAAAVELPGRVLMDPNAGGLVQPSRPGRIEAGPRGLPTAGQAVRSGEVLAWVRFEPEPYALAAQQAQLAELRSSRQLAEQRVQRLAGLEGSVPRKEIEAARAEAESLAARERSIGGSLGAREALRAPITGVIARADAAVGQVVAPGAMLFEVVDPAHVVVEAVTADGSLPAHIANAQLKGMPDLTLQWLGAARSLRDGVLPLNFRARAAKGAALPLAIGQPVTVVATLATKVKGTVLPAEAVVRNPANEPVVWIKSGAERYIAQPVRVQALDASRVVVTQGLGEGNRVVVQGAALLAQIR